MNDSTIVYVWNQKKLTHVATPVRSVVCPECGNVYKDDKDGSKFWIDGYGATAWDEFLQCECGEYFTQRND